MDSIQGTGTTVIRNSGRSTSGAASTSQRDGYSGSVEQAPSWLGKGRLLRAVGAVTLAGVMLVGCTPPPQGAHQPEQAKQEQPAPPAQPPSACTQLKTLTAEAAPTDPTLADAHKAEIELASANCKIEVAEKQAEVAQKQAEATERMAKAAEKQAAAAQQQADIAKRQEQIRNARAAAEVGAAVGSALGHGINNILR